jgi:hypothetical protein
MSFVDRALSKREEVHRRAGSPVVQLKRINQLTTIRPTVLPLERC